MKFSIRNILKYTAVVAVFICGACSDDFMVSDETDNSSLSKGLTFMCGDMLEVYSGMNNDATRAGDDKREEEKKIKTLHVFFFDGDSDGELLTANFSNFPAYQKINVEKEKGASDMFLMSLSDGQWDSASGLFKNKEGNSAKKNIRLVAIANIDAVEGIDPEDLDNRFFTKYSEGGKIQEAGRIYSNPFEITSYSDLQKWVYYPKIRMNEDGTNGDISALPDAGMPMIGEQIVDLSQKNPIVINMKALMAKVNVAVKLDPDQFTDNLPTLVINEYGVLNMPIAVPFRQPTGEPVEGWVKPADLDAYFDAYDVTKQPMFHKNGTPSNWNDNHAHCEQANHEFTNKLEDPIRIRKGSDPVLLCSYYTFENINMPDYAAQRASVSGETKEAFTGTGGSSKYEPNYPEGVSKEDYQRWKPTIAYKDRASALILKGEFTTHQGLTYQAQFTIYLGMDTDTDFKVKRNHKYDNNIVIKGLEYVRNSVDDVYTFDGRVNVVSDNPLYLAIVNERKVDVHATALPMDVWLLNYEDFTPEPEDYYTDVTFTIPENAQDWIQMVMIPRSEMQSKDGRFYAGTGIEKYFYSNLLSDIKDHPERILKGWETTVNGTTAKPYEGHKEGARCGSKITVSCTPEANNSRSRIYFYIDENSKNWQFDNNKNCTGTADRSVKIQVKYKSYRLNDAKTDTVSGSVTEKFRTIEIEQRGLRRVKNKWEHPTNGNTDNIPETFIEYYEEYLNHNDPLDEHVSGDVYIGLGWGMSGKEITFSNTYENATVYNVFKGEAACAMTKWAIDNTKDNGKDRMIDVKLFDKDNHPYSAFHYCYGKNKRAYDGKVEDIGNYGWYMPGIRELETALVQYYETFVDFQNNYYWSAACANENPAHITNNYSRSTKVYVGTNGKASYVESEWPDDDPDVMPGCKLRSEELRIRSFYRRKP